jgi:hypothetical protein
LHARLENGDCLQIVASAKFRRFAVTNCSLKLLEQDSFFGLWSRTASHKSRQSAVLPKYQPAMKHV